MNAMNAFEKFFSLAATAARTGGFWVSASGGTANVAAGVLSRRLGISFEEAHEGLDRAGGPGWYERLARSQPYPYGDIPDHVRWDVGTIAAAAARGAL